MKRFRLLNAILLLFTGLFTTACFDILEEYEFNADGSGRARMVIDVSGMMDMMASFSAMDSTGEAAKGMDEMFTDNSAIETLKQIPGISNVASLNDRETKTVGYSYEFANLEALNNALATSNETMDFASMGIGSDMSTESAAGNYFARKGKKFSRVMDFEDDKKSSESEGEEGGDDEQYKQMARMMFADATYEVRYTFANGVKKVKKNPAAQLGPDGKTVVIKQGMVDIMDNKAQMGCDIILK